MDDPEKVTYFAETDFRNSKTKFGIKRKDRTRHTYIIGKTGMGKSTLLENLAIQDIQNGEGLAFIDPHGSTAEKLLEYVPESRIQDVIYFAPFDLDNPISFNVLEGIDEERKHLIAAGLMNAFKKIWADAFSGRMEYILSMTLLALLDNPGETLLGVNRMYSDKDYRKKIVNNIKDPSVRSFWVDEYAKYSEKFAQEATASIQNKIGQFTANPLIRNLLGQQKSSFDFRRVMDEKKILIVNLSKGKMGPDNMRLIGGMVVTKIYLAAMSRADATASELKRLAPFYLFVDEFQNFANESFAEILSESRKYNLALTVANQYIDQMTEEVRGAILGNVGSMITFRIGAPDAEIMEKEFTPYFTAEDLVNLGFAQVYLKLMIDGVGSPPFSANTLDRPAEPEKTNEQEIIEFSRRSYCKPRAQVEADIANWFAPAISQISKSESRNENFKKPDTHQVHSVQRQNGTHQNNNDIFKRDKSRTENIQTTQKSGIQGQERVQQKNVNDPAVVPPTKKSDIDLKDMLRHIQSGELIEIAPEKKDKSHNNNHTQDSVRIPLSTIAKDKATSFSNNKNNLREAIAKALEEAKQKESITDKVFEGSEKKEDKSDYKTPEKEQIKQQEVPEDVLKKLLEVAE